jgi:hypothetical protein
VANVALVTVLCLIGGTVYVGYLAFKGEIAEEALSNDPRVWIVAGWALMFLFYLYMIGSLRGCIRSSLARVRSPLDM